MCAVMVIPQAQQYGLNVPAYTVRVCAATVFDYSAVTTERGD
ncbi:MAG: hypothetical protein NVSMB52_15210 [Chloroflexota bacterium]